MTVPEAVGQSPMSFAPKGQGDFVVQQEYPMGTPQGLLRIEDMWRRGSVSHPPSTGVMGKVQGFGFRHWKGGRVCPKMV